MDSGLWEGLQPQRDHTLTQNNAIAIIGINILRPFAVLTEKQNPVGARSWIAAGSR